METRNLQILDWFQTYHPEMRMIGRMHHYGCNSCGGTIGRSGHLHVDTNSIRCFQPTCEFGNKWHHAEQYIRKFDVRGFERLGLRDKADYQPFERKTRKEDARLPDGFTPILQGTGLVAREAREYLLGRGFDLGELWSRYGVGYVSEGESKWFYNIVIPWRDEMGLLQYWQGRDFSNGLFNGQRWKFPSESESPMSAAQVLFNQRKLLTEGQCWLVEGAMDAMTLDGLGVPGKTLSKHHVSLIENALFTDVLIAFDEGAWLDTLNAAKSLLPTGKSIYGVVIEGEGEYKARKKDANSLGRNRMEQMQRIRITADTIADEFRRVRIEGPHTYRGLAEEISLW